MSADLHNILTCDVVTMLLSSGVLRSPSNLVKRFLRIGIFNWGWLRQVGTYRLDRFDSILFFVYVVDILQ
jgi:hypothetical protein